MVSHFAKMFFSDQKCQKVAKLQEKGPKHVLITISTSWLKTDPSKIVLWVNHRISKSLELHISTKNSLDNW